MVDFSPLPRLVENTLLFLDEVELEEYVESIDLGLVWMEELSCFEALTLGLLQEDGPR